MAICYHYLTKKQSHKKRKIILQIIGVTLAVLEIIKILYHVINKTFTPVILPFHFCSVFIYLIPLAQFLPNKLAKHIKPLPFCYAIMVIIILWVNPGATIGNASAGIFKSFPNFHTFFFHQIVIAYFVFSIAINDYVPKLSHCLNLAIGVVVYSCYAIPAAFLLNNNYVNILFSLFKPLETFRINYGQFWYDLCLFILAIIGISLIHIIYYVIYRLLHKKTDL